MSWLLWIALLGCGGGEPPAQTPASTPASPAEAATEPAPLGASPIRALTGADEAALLVAERAATELGGQLQAALRGAAASGDVAAVDACHGNASPLTLAVAEQAGVRLGRSSLKLRNPGNAPEGWVQGWLLAQVGKPYAEVDSYREVVDLGDRRVVRLIRPLPVVAECVRCHGDAVSPAVTAAIRERYPADAAVGYQVGDLRGGLWVEAPVGADAPASGQGEAPAGGQGDAPAGGQGDAPAAPH